MQRYNTRFILAIFTLICVLLGLIASEVEAGGKGNKGKGGEDFILYNGNIVLRDKEGGGSFVVANNHPTQEEVEFAPDYFRGELGGQGGFWRR